MKVSLEEKIYNRILTESEKSNGSHREESNKYGWPKFDVSWLDKEGLTTWDEDRKTVKAWLKKMGLN